MNIAHIALWTHNLEQQVIFWRKYFSGIPGEKYLSRNNPGFESCFIRLEAGATIELMTKPGLLSGENNDHTTGWAHIALSLGGKQQVNDLAEQARRDGILLSEPHLTGDGYYEAVLQDPDGNRIEIVA